MDAGERRVTRVGDRSLDRAGRLGENPDRRGDKQADRENESEAEPGLGSLSLLSPPSILASNPVEERSRMLSLSRTSDKLGVRLGLL